MDGPDRIHTSRATSGEDSQMHRILVVDDESDIRDAVDLILRYENIRDWNALPHINLTHLARDNNEWQLYYDSEHRGMVHEAFEEDFLRFQYYIYP